MGFIKVNVVLKEEWSLVKGFINIEILRDGFQKKSMWSSRKRGGLWSRDSFTQKHEGMGFRLR